MHTLTMIHRGSQPFQKMQDFWPLDTDEREDDIDQETEAQRLKKIMAEAKERMIKK